MKDRLQNKMETSSLKLVMTMSRHYFPCYNKCQLSVAAFVNFTCDFNVTCLPICFVLLMPQGNCWYTCLKQSICSKNIKYILLLPYYIDINVNKFTTYNVVELLNLQHKRNTVNGSNVTKFLHSVILFDLFFSSVWCCDFQTM